MNLRKFSLLLFTVFLLSACNAKEGGQKPEAEKIKEVEDTEEKVEAAPQVKGIITIAGTEYELFLNDEGYDDYELNELAYQLTPITVRPEEIATIQIDGNPNISVKLWSNGVPVESDSFQVPYERGRYTFKIKAQWPNNETNFFTVLEVPYQFKRVDRETEPNDPNPWIPSPNGEKEVLLEGYGEFESVGTVVLKDLKNNSIENIELNHGRQSTPKKIEWFDDDSLLMIIGMTHGTVTRGGDVYHLNLNTLEFTPVIELSVKEEVSDFNIEGNKLMYDVFIHDEDYNDGHLETRTFDLSTIPNIQ